MRRLEFPKRFAFIFLLLSIFAASLFLGPGTPSRAAAPETGLVAFWKFDEGGGFTALDFAGNGNNGSLENGPAWANGKFNAALNFDGEDDYLQIHGLSQYVDFTITGWIYLNDQASTEPNGNNSFFEKNSADNRILLRPSGYYIEFNGKYGQGVTESNVNQWVYIAISKEGSTASYYRNAALVKSWNVDATPVDFTSGSIGGAGKYWFNGLIDEVRLYSRSLSASEIAELYGQGQSEDTLPPSIPGNVGATSQTPYHVQLAWEASMDNDRVAGYKIYRDGNHIDSVSTTIYTDSNLSPGMQYSYQVSAMDSSGNESGLSDPIEVATRLVAVRDHPRLYLTNEKIVFLKGKVDSGVEPYQTFWRVTRIVADQYASEAPYPADDPKVTSPYGSREIGDRLPYFAMAYRLSGDPKYLNAARAWMNAIVNYPTWGGDQDLVASHILFGMGVAYDWLYDEFSPQERESYAAKMEYHAEILYQLLVNVDIWWADNYQQNHNYVNTLAIMSTAVALYDVADHPDGYIQAAYDDFTHVLQALPPDGGYTEGAAYWTYGSDALMRYFALEQDVLGIDRIVTNAWFQNTGKYRLYASIPGYNQVIQIADVYDQRQDWYSPAVLQRLASKFNDSHSQWLASKIIEAHQHPPVDWKNLLFYDETVPAAPPDNMTTHWLFEDIGLFTSRSDWQDPSATLLVFKAGPPMGHQAHEVLKLPTGSGHAHPDAGVILLDAYGQYMIVDNGYQYGWLTADHNTLTFDGGIGQLGETLNPNGLNIPEVIANGGTADIVHSEFTEDYEYLVADLTKMYKPELQLTKLLRHVLFVKKDIIIVIDEIESSITHDVEWRLHIDETANVILDGRNVVATFPGSDAGLLIEEISPETYSMRVDDYLVSYTHPEAGITTTFQSKLLQILPHASSARIETIIRPFQGATPESAIVLERADGNLRLQIEDWIIDISTLNREVHVREASVLQGDINGDGLVNEMDVQACVDHLLGIQDWGEAADVNGDGQVDVLDLQMIVKILSEK
jgi:hypothetical protein